MPSDCYNNVLVRAQEKLGTAIAVGRAITDQQLCDMVRSAYEQEVASLQDYDDEDEDDDGTDEDDGTALGMWTGMTWWAHSCDLHVMCAQAGAHNCHLCVMCVAVCTAGGWVAGACMG